MAQTREIPRFFHVRQKFVRPQVGDIPGTVATQLASLFPPGSFKPGARIGVTAGSRGISNIAEIIRATVEFLKSRDAAPFVVPAMGSHGGATAEGQKALIAHYGITEETMGCPIRAEMKTRVIGTSPKGIDAYLAEVALDSEGIILVNRVKPHTDYKGPIESGLTKICGIGLGKLEGATEYHSRLFDLGLGTAIREAAEVIVDAGVIVGGLAILENAYHETARIVAVPVDTLFETETELLNESRGLMGRLPFMEADLLMCDQMGKNVSGAGLDTNIVGRSVQGYIQGQPWIEGMPKVHRIFVRTLTEESNGNAVGMGLVEFSTTRFMERVNHEYTRLNAFTACSPLGAKPPIAMKNDHESVSAALGTCMLRANGPLAIYVKDTLSLEDAYLSEAFLSDSRQRDDLSILGDPEPLPFDADGWLQSPFGEAPGSAS